VVWADVSPGSGQGNAAPVLTIGEHANRDARTLSVTVNGQSVRVTQNAIGCSYSVSRTSMDVSPQGESVSIDVTTADGCVWTATSSDGWINVRTPSGAGSSTLGFDIAPNTGDTRRAFLTIAGLRVDITQQRR
jgi:hypothetical protein